MTLTQISSRGVEDALRWSLGAGGSNYYTFTGPGLTGTVNNPTIYLSRGHTYIFENNNSTNAHPFQIQSTSGQGGTAYNTGVTNNGGGGGSEIKITVPHGAPDILYYQCTAHANMGGTIYITGAVADGTITTAKLADDAVTTAKIADGNVDTAQLADNSVRTSKINDANVTQQKLADGAVSTSKLLDAGASGNTGITTAKIADDAVTYAKMQNTADGVRFLGKHDSGGGQIGEITKAQALTMLNVADGATYSNINGNVDGRVLTATGTTGVSQGESGLTFASNVLNVQTGYAIQNVGGTISGSGGGQDRLSIKDSGGTERLTVKTHGTGIGNVGINTTAPSTGLSVINDSATEGFNVKHSNLSAGVGIGYNTITSVGTNTNQSLSISTKGTGSNLDCRIGNYNVFGAMQDSRDFRIFKNANGWSTLTMDADGGITGPLRRHVRRMNNGANSVATINVFRLRRYNWGSGFFEVRMYGTYYSGSYLKRFRINGHGAGGNHYSVATMDDKFTNGGGATWGVGCQIANASSNAPGDSTTYYCDVQVTIPNYWYGLCELVMSSGYQTNNANAGTSMASNSYTLWT